MTLKNETERLLGDPLLPLDVPAKKWNVSTRFLRLEEKRGRLKIVRLSARVCRVRASEVRRYEAAREAAA